MTPCAVALAIGTALGGVDAALAQLGTGSDAVAAEKGPVRTVDPRAFPNLTVIYSAPGVLDNGGAQNAGVATTILCTNWTGVTQQVRFLVRDYTKAIVADQTFLVTSQYTHTVSTHGTFAFAEDAYLSAGTAINPGSLRIFATSPQVSCTASVIDAATLVPHGIDLHLVRQNVWPNTQE